MPGQVSSVTAGCSSWDYITGLSYVVFTFLHSCLLASTRQVNALCLSHSVFYLGSPLSSGQYVAKSTHLVVGLGFEWIVVYLFSAAYSYSFNFHWQYKGVFMLVAGKLLFVAMSHNVLRLDMSSVALFKCLLT